VTAAESVGLILAIGLLVYLVITLLLPERF
jgi:K+-transporting ATPase KdpF subunit